ncbi:hypothetical protein PSN45_002125 [Yamadazyma tenuis]|uniref:Biogenesis of lysosome-related organelles complex 1 subunit 2 n=1 Tax=Candida tenuis (strain ATCC 10573 / BCRC 21748 / CBS 615 / JCM 9827 / NBRC 10315 / NRRL Y-1498 / VKM Y-70) TaxID=590646 RepID=G3BC69_CANTC|nr:uncharacterized protein CANTEDRAFT_111632 [Yamadazyma tenuis ATCC 10573]EGV60134.1 hypothetical protein CANTEDRAFT_111632 [Yamadazyma tenuis ATCC 10573]WEJ94634.1 hypothetical protein PSN45_002125 [Yamadazyma tenuis]
MSASRDTGKLAYHGLTTLSRLVESDTEVATIDLNLLENLNTNQALNYIKLEQKLDALDTHSNTLKAIDEEYGAYVKLLDDIDDRSQKLDQLVDELDAWTKELDKSTGAAR